MKETTVETPKLHKGIGWFQNLLQLNTPGRAYQILREYKVDGEIRIGRNVYFDEQRVLRFLADGGMKKRRNGGRNGS